MRKQPPKVGRPSLSDNERQDHKVSFGLDAQRYNFVCLRGDYFGSKSNHYRFLLDRDYREYLADITRREQEKAAEHNAPAQQVPSGAQRLQEKWKEVMNTREQLAKLEREHEAIANEIQAAFVTKRRQRKGRNNG